ncbi:MAG: pilus assembly protein N-terminal domain-containing protein [Proteobacteria bacterium]|nr:pilus assembly protein N-terminal domain-containing protein [Pseudomonadota bacterium]
MRIGQWAIRRMLAAATLAMVAGLAPVPASAMDSVEVEMDNARLLKVPEGTDTIVIGNPLIADVSVQRNNVMVITGKLYGTTNMIALDNKGAIISESRLVVSAPRKDRLVVLRGGTQETYSCSPDCGPSLQIGDADANFNRAITQATQRASGIKNAGVDRTN